MSTRHNAPHTLGSESLKLTAKLNVNYYTWNFGLLISRAWLTNALKANNLDRAYVQFFFMTFRKIFKTAVWLDFAPE